MKHNPRVNERVVNLPRLPRPAPAQEEDGAQGALELMWRLQEILAEVAGLLRCRSSPRRVAGRAHRPDAHARVLRERGEADVQAQDRHPRHGARNEPASVTMAGYE
jgi:glycine dehydrogenase subunit 2